LLIVGETIEEAERTCPHCGRALLRLIAEYDKPSWKQLLWRQAKTCPPWYAESLHEDHRRYWASQYGSDFYDSYEEYLKTPLEGAKPPGGSRAEPIRLWLPGMAIGGSYGSDWF
jgi:hypothetical protein